MFCEKCGAELADKSKFCDACGAQTAVERENIQTQTIDIRKKNPPPYKKNAVILTIMFWVLMPGLMFVLSEGEFITVFIGCVMAAAFTAFTWIMCMYSYNKYMKSSDSHDINRKQ